MKPAPPVTRQLEIELPTVRFRFCQTPGEGARSAGRRKPCGNLARESARGGGRRKNALIFRNSVCRSGKGQGDVSSDQHGGRCNRYNRRRRRPERHGSHLVPKLCWGTDPRQAPFAGPRSGASPQTVSRTDVGDEAGLTAASPLLIPNSQFPIPARQRSSSRSDCPGCVSSRIGI